MSFRQSFIASILAVSTLTGCNKWLHSRALKMYDPVTIEERLDEEGNEIHPFDLLHEGLEKHLKAIYIIDHKHLYANNKYTKGHAHKKNGFICVSKPLTEYTLLHEAAHIRHYALDKEGCDFSARWKAIARINYGTYTVSKPMRWKDNNGFMPRHGCMTPYGSVSLKEDIADYTAESRRETNFDRIVKRIVFTQREHPELESAAMDRMLMYAAAYSKRSLYFCDPEDPRYRNKIKLLFEYSFITEERYEFMTDMIGVAHKFAQTLEKK